MQTFRATDNARLVLGIYGYELTTLLRVCVKAGLWTGLMDWTVDWTGLKNGLST